MQKILSFFIILLFSSTQLLAQTDSSVYKWTITSKKISEKKYELILKASALGANQLYAPQQDLDGVKSAEVSFFDSSIAVENFIAVSPTQTIKSTIFENKMVQVQTGNVEWKVIVNFSTTVPANLLGNLTFFYNKDDEFTSDPPFAFNANIEGGLASGGKIKIASIDIKKPQANCGDDDTQNKSIFTIFILGFLGGLIALITPCVFPMIPVTVTFFTKKAQTKKAGIRNAVFYGFFIFLIYVAITIPFHLASKTISPEIFNNISTNVWLNLIFFAVFVFFALSFFGL